jgi:membrane protein YqaA with SNARE-associated domain
MIEKMPAGHHIPPNSAVARPHSALLHWIIGFGGVGLFFVSIVDSSVIPLPLPGSTDVLLLILCANRQDTWPLFALVAIAGAMVGGYLSYRLAAKGGNALLERYVPARFRERITRWVQTHPMLAIGVPALLPPPVPLTPFVIAAGALQMPRRQFLTAFGLCRAVRYTLVAWLGQHYGRHLVRLYRRYFGEDIGPVVWIIVALLAVTVAVVIWQVNNMKSKAKPARSK